MGRSFYGPSAGNVIEDYTADNHLFHAPSNRHYRMVQRKRQVSTRGRYQLDAQGREKNVFELEVTHIMGSGNHARTYLNLDGNGVLRQLPVSWYSQGKGWGMSPGYDHARHDDFRRRVGHSCMFCHNGYPRLPEPSDRYGHQNRFPQDLPSGIDCQRCHGPGSRHVDLLSGGEAAMEAVRAAILNPVRLSPERQMDVCMQCHVQSTLGNLGDRVRRAGRSVYSFRPGESLDDYIVHFDLVELDPGKPADRFEIDSTAYRLFQSSCFLESRGTMTCTTCHDPHRTPRGPEAVRHFRQRCMSCHPGPSGEVHPQPAQSNCVRCHMPRRRTEDAVHVVMTDHWIQRRLPGRDLLAPLQEDHSPHEGAVVLHDPESLPASERDIYWGLAQIQSPSNLEQGLSRLKRPLEPGALPLTRNFLPNGATALLEAGERDTAEVRLRQALQLDSSMVIARNKLGEVLREQGKPGTKPPATTGWPWRSIPPMEKPKLAWDSLPKDRSGPMRPSATFARQCNTTPFWAEGFANLGTAYLQQGRWVQAVQELEKALSIEPGNPQVHLNLGTALSRAGRLPEALEAFAETVRLKPDFPEAHYSLGLARARSGRPRQAIEAFRQAVQLTPEDADFHYNLGVAHNELGQLEEAVEAFRQAVRLRPDDAEGLSSLGLGLCSTGPAARGPQGFSKDGGPPARRSGSPILFGNGSSHAGEPEGGNEGVREVETPGRTPKGGDAEGPDGPETPLAIRPRD